MTGADERVHQLDKALRGEPAELTAFSVQELLARIHELEAQNAELRASLQRADEVRETWDRRTHTSCGSGWRRRETSETSREAPRCSTGCAGRH
jgi:uncharacterized small protein (DUF1192 family)